jgi:hypothetical protein
MCIILQTNEKEYDRLNRMGLTSNHTPVVIERLNSLQSEQTENVTTNQQQPIHTKRFFPFQSDDLTITNFKSVRHE